MKMRLFSFLSVTCVCFGQGLLPATYVWSQAPGGTLSSGTGIPITLTPCPLGVNSNNVGFYVYVSGGSGGAEALEVQGTMYGGTCLSGHSSGTIYVSPNNTHTGAWTVGTATSGIAEAAVVANAAGGGTVVLSPGTLTDAPVTLSGSNIAIDGLGSGSIINQSLTTDALALSACLRCTLKDFGIDSVPASLSAWVTATATSWTVSSAITPPATPFYSFVDDSEVVNVTGISGTTWTVTRAQAGTTGVPHSSGALITLAQGGAGIDFVTYNSPVLESTNVRIYHQYRGIYMQVAPDASNWANTHIESSNYRGIDAPAINDEKFSNTSIVYSIDAGLQIGPGLACIGSFEMTNPVIYDNRGNNINLDGTSAYNPCTLLKFTGVTSDSAGQNGLYAINANNLIVVGFAGGGNKVHSIDLEENTSAIFEAVNTGGAGQEGILISDAGGLATQVSMSGITTMNNGTSGTYCGIKITGAASHVNINGLQTGNIFTTNQSCGIDIDNTGGTDSYGFANPTDVQIMGTQFPGLIPANYIVRSSGIPVVGLSGGDSIGVAVQLDFNSSAASSTGTQSVANNTWTSVTYDANVYDASLHSTSSNTSRFSIPAGGDGLYQVICQDTFASNATGLRYGRILKTNGSGSTAFAPTSLSAVSGDVTGFQNSATIQLAGSDYVECQVAQTSGASLAMGGVASGQITKVR